MAAAKRAVFSMNFSKTCGIKGDAAEPARLYERFQSPIPKIRNETGVRVDVPTQCRVVRPIVRNNLHIGIIPLLQCSISFYLVGVTSTKGSRLHAAITRPHLLLLFLLLRY